MPPKLPLPRGWNRRIRSRPLGRSVAVPAPEERADDLAVAAATVLVEARKGLGERTAGSDSVQRIPSWTSICSFSRRLPAVKSWFSSSTPGKVP